MIILLVIAAVAVSTPVIAVVLVSLASHREDSAHSLAGRPSGPVQAAARRLVGFHGDGIARRPAGRPVTRGPRPAAGRRPAGGELSGGEFSGDDGLADRPDVPRLVA